ncbi:MAG: hypothetical protein JO279_15325 [Verrucomicrobia bacterium]|nr:hypothetical protein [Verrucomicrobiota bacterium]
MKGGLRLPNRPRPVVVLVLDDGILLPALREDVEGEDDLIVGTCVTALLQLLAQLVKAKEDAAAIVRLVEITGLPVDGKLAQGVPSRSSTFAG